MRATNSLARWGLAACLVVGSAGLLKAQDTGFSHDFKLRLGYTPSSKDHLRGDYQSFGWNFNYGVGAGKVGFELGYMYMTGDPYITAPDESRIPAGYAPVDPAKVVEDKRNELSGFTVRLTWAQKLSDEWDWQAGLQVGPKFKHQYVADVHSTAEGTTWEDTYNGTPVKGGFSNLSPFGGVTWKLDTDSSLELNLMLLRYDAIEYHHYAGTGTYYRGGTQDGLNDPKAGFPYDKLDKHSRMVPHFEIAYVFHF